jgi:hypothetical protein
MASWRALDGDGGREGSTTAMGGPTMAYEEPSTTAMGGPTMAYEEAFHDGVREGHDGVRGRPCRLSSPESLIHLIQLVHLIHLIHLAFSPNAAIRDVHHLVVNIGIFFAYGT